MEIKKTMMKAGILISLANGLVLGAVFSAIGMSRSPDGIEPAGVVTSALISAAISAVIGLIIPMKNVTEKVRSKLGIDPRRQRYAAWLIEGITGDLIFTPILCTFFVFMNYFRHKLPPQVPVVPFWLKELGIDLLIALPITMITVPLVRKLTFRLLGIPGSAPPAAAPPAAGKEDIKNV